MKRKNLRDNHPYLLIRIQLNNTASPRNNTAIYRFVLDAFSHGGLRLHPVGYNQTRYKFDLL